MPKPPPAPSPIWTLINRVAALNVAVFRLTRGRVGGRLRGAPVLLLHHVGRRSGRPRVTPLLYLADGDRLVVVASKGGTTTHPAWYHNLRAHPDTQVELPGERRRVHARLIVGEERAALWPKLVAMYGDYAAYQRYAGARQIPLIYLESSEHR